MLQQMPAALPLYLKAAASARRRPKEKPVIPALELRLPGLQVDGAKLAAYNATCGFAESETLPITYPQVLAAPLHMHMMTQPQFPLPLLGLVHIRNHIEQDRELRRDETFEVVVKTGAARDVRQGLEFDIATEFSTGSDVVWRAITTVLHRMPGPKGGGGKAPPAPEVQLAQYHAFDAPADIGRRYAKVSGDYNPIHLSATSARLFGFKRAIAHGMWSLARCTALLQGELAAAPSTLDVQFKQPLFLPGKVGLKYLKTGEGVDFALLSRNSDKVHLSGALR